ncbi:MAG TPA: hypothetical protein VHO29_13770 [Marmoricola sp.]|nr:hypothetical protein [Marmoricola sp.]
MQEPLGPRLRPTGMRTAVVAMMLCVPLLLAGCGNEAPVADHGGQTTSSAPPSCTGSTGSAIHVTVQADLDGDGRPETVDYVDTPGCQALRAEVGGKSVTAPVAGDMALRQGELAAVQIPGRTGQLVLARQEHPRGGFQARLYGYADGTLEELTAEGKPIFDFIATDVLTTPTAATCTNDGFIVTQARRHQPIGIVPAWDVFRTTYEVDGNVVRPGPTTKVADNVLEKDFATTYADLVHYSLFKDCLVAG